MPIRDDQAELYPADWDALTLRMKEAAGWRCQCHGECGRALDHLLPGDGRCRNRHGEPKWGRTKNQRTAILSVAHRNHDVTDLDEDNLIVYCGGCHVVHDQAHHWHTRREREYAEMGILPLFDLDTLAPTEDGEPACV